MEFLADKKRKILFIKRFSSKDFFHGGLLRSESIHEKLCSKYDLSTLSNSSFKHKIFQIISFLIESDFRSLNLKGKIIFIRDIYNSPYLKRFSNFNLIIEYKPGFTDLILKKIQFKKVLLLTHNIEYLVPFHKHLFKEMDAKKFEMRSWRLADSIITNSEFDAKIISQYISKPIDVINDYPTPSRIKKLGYKKWLPDPKDKFYLAFGAASNPPTLASLKRVRDLFVGNFPEKKLIIFGKNTHKIRSANNVVCLGYLDHASCLNLQLRCQAVVFDNIFTSGFLTKLYELNYLGVPVIDFGEYNQTYNLEIFGIFKSFRSFNERQEIKNFLPSSHDPLFRY